MYRISTAFMAIVCALAALFASGIRAALDILAGEPAPGGAMALGVLAAAALGAAALRLLPRAVKGLPLQDAPAPPAAPVQPGPAPNDVLVAKERLLAEAAAQPATLASDMARAIATAMSRAETASRASSEWAAPMQHIRELLDGCDASLEALDQAMDRVRAQSSRASSKLSVISDTAAEAQSLVAGMSSIAEQTDMLSVNASIEAEKAGEHGRGFAVVAREVRRLADTAQSGAQDVERLVARMRQAVASEVMEMDSFTREAAGGDSRLEELALALREASRALNGAVASLEQSAARSGEVPPALDLAMAMARDLEASLAELGELAASGDGRLTGQHT